MTDSPGSSPIDQLRWMDDRLDALIAVADEQTDHLLAALLSEAHDRVLTRYALLVGP